MDAMRAGLHPDHPGVAGDAGARSAEVTALIGEEGARVWRLYMAGGALAFDEGRMGVHQILAVRPCVTATFWITLLVSAAAVTALLLLTFAVALRVGRYNVVDTVWGLGFAVIAVVAFALSAGHGSEPRRILLLAATVIWGGRLAAYVGWRSRGKGEDPRYTEMLGKAPGSRAAYALRKVFLLQAALIWLISVPVQAGMFEGRGPSWLLAAGGAIWLFGLAFEAIGDGQLAAFKADPASRGTVMDRGPVALYPPPELLWRRLRVVGPVPDQLRRVARADHDLLAAADDVPARPRQRQAHHRGTHVRPARLRAVRGAHERFRAAAAAQVRLGPLSSRRCGRGCLLKGPIAPPARLS